jgi:prophage regulatory protein
MKSQREQQPDGFREFVRMKMLREREVKQITGLSRCTRWRLERRGEFPKRVSLTQRCVAWPEAEILAWLEKRAEARNA